MSTWTTDELTRIGGAGEMDIATRRADGTLRRPRIIWVVRFGDSLNSPLGQGPAAAWYRGPTRMQGHIQAGGLDKDVAFVDADHGLDDAIDDAYRAKYRLPPVGRRPHHQRAGALDHDRARTPLRQRVGTDQQ